MNLEQLETLYTAASDSVFNEHEETNFQDITQNQLKREMRRAGLRAVVEALRDEIIPERMKLTKANNTCTRASLRLFFHKILGSDGGEKAAGGSTSNDERGLHALDTRPAAELRDSLSGITDYHLGVGDMEGARGMHHTINLKTPDDDFCQWAHDGKNLWFAYCDKQMGHRSYPSAPIACPACKRPIKYRWENKNG
jgi:hypothetical protein